MLDYGEKPEVIARFVGVIGGGIVLYFHSHWIISLVWVFFFVKLHIFYFLFLRSRGDVVSPREHYIAASLFLLLLIAFLWLPAVLIVQDDEALVFAGAALIGCILVFLVYRCDTLMYLVIGEIVVVAIMIGWILYYILPDFGTVPTKMAIVVCGLALLGYLTRSILQGRAHRMASEAAATGTAQAQKMAAIGRLAGGVAHDFNNILTAIQGNLELYGEFTDQRDKDESVRRAHTASQQAEVLVRQLMVYARKSVMDVGIHDVDRIFEEFLSLLRHLVPGSINVVAKRPERGLFAWADSKQMVTALINLAQNAVDAMPDGGVLTVSARGWNSKQQVPTVDGDTLPSGSYIVFEVEDTGRGIDSAVMDRVVEPFFTTKPVGQGSGLGLSMVLGLARELGGGLQISSSAKGTKVSILLRWIEEGEFPAALA